MLDKIYFFTRRLFVQPLFNGVLLDQSLLLNRRRTDDEFKSIEEDKVRFCIATIFWNILFIKCPPLT